MSLEMREKYAKGVCSSEYIRTGTPRFAELGMTPEQVAEADALCREIEAKTAEMIEKDIKPKDKAEKVFDEILEKLSKKVISKREAKRSAQDALMEYLTITSFGGTTVEKYIQIADLCRARKEKRNAK